ncbi:hydroxyacylglutathione hydrolase [Massilia sp. RP-1-19]|uniref:Hydroxyacylglutathione hydrolase n=1 Tax=Massilia polaris TaxID=2728846 RepID=A0A848HH65_9BURK|nr:hydroxyacylglutathione hydrolase [Massilia polaris]NML60765.1 hydroxyacylglutathione hydrolase [Massilia polaris]
MTSIPRSDLTVLAIPAFKDNYLWLIHDGVKAAVVDPGDAEPIIEALTANNLALTAILLTHHHADHIGGVQQLLAHASVPVFGPRNDDIPAVTHPLAQGDHIRLRGLELALSVLDVPGHTLGHIAYVRATAGARWLFCGDTLFAGGCGRVFEGTAAQMADSLGKLAALPNDTKVFCAHEYTLANLRFAQAVEPGNADLAKRVEVETAKRARNEPTVPSTIALEKATNPFLRYREPAIVDTLVKQGRLEAGAPPVHAFAALREWKNTF